MRVQRVVAELAVADRGEAVADDAHRLHDGVAASIVWIAPVRHQHVADGGAVGALRERSRERQQRENR